MPDPITVFYQKYLPAGILKNNLLQVACPFCKKKNMQQPGQLTIFLNIEHLFHGYFRCSNHLCEGGFPIYFAQIAEINPKEIPGHNPERVFATARISQYPKKNINQEVIDYSGKMAEPQLQYFQDKGITKTILESLNIGYNGRYLTFPYMLADKNYYTARCVHPEQEEDSFWFGSKEVSQEKYHIFNREEIGKCEDGSLIITEDETNLLVLKQLSLPAIALPTASELEYLDPQIFQWVKNIFLWVNNTHESMSVARTFATLAGYKVRLVQWPKETQQLISLKQVAAQNKTDIKQFVFSLLLEAKSFSPFSSLKQESHFLNQILAPPFSQRAKEPNTGFPALDQIIGNQKGINIMGGTPKAGKSCFFLQIASEMARQKIPIIYYDFENGKQKLYERIISRIGKIKIECLRSLSKDEKQKNIISQATNSLQSFLRWFRVVNDRKLTPELMRRHIDFIQHETGSRFTTVIIDSLHKLPFKNLSERRTGIDAWLRELEAIRDEQNVTFWVISELTRGQDGQFERIPQLGSFKGSGDIAYSADNALVFLPKWDPFDNTPPNKRINDLWLVASREKAPGKIASYRLDYPYWGFIEEK